MYIVLNAYVIIRVLVYLAGRLNNIILYIIYKEITKSFKVNIVYYYTKKKMNLLLKITFKL